MCKQQAEVPLEHTVSGKSAAPHQSVHTVGRSTARAPSQRQNRGSLIANPPHSALYFKFVPFSKLVPFVFKFQQKFETKLFLRINSAFFKSFQIQRITSKFGNLKSSINLIFDFQILFKHLNGFYKIKKLILKFLFSSTINIRC